MMRLKSPMMSFIIGFIFFFFFSQTHSQMISENPEKFTEIAIKIDGKVDVNELAREFGMKYIGKVGNLEDFHIFGRNSSHFNGKKRNLNEMENHPNVLWFEEQVKRKRAKRSVVNPLGITDPLYQNQWHLHSESNPNVESVWQKGITGKGMVIAVVDDGIQYDHPDLAQNYKKEFSYDFNYDDNNPYPDAATDDHGTSIAGVIAAGRNNHCGVGVAYDAGLSALRLISTDSTDAQEAKTLVFKNNDIHVYSNSWGPIDDGRRKEGPGVLGMAALINGIQKGRGGKGSIYCWAAGNGRPSRDNCNYDGWANSRYTITVGAVMWDGKVAPYSEPCSMVVTTAPSSGRGRALTTTDLMGRRGSSTLDCTADFGGTSASAPIGAAVMALILQVRPELTWRDLQAVLVDSATKNDVNSSSWQQNGSGRLHSHDYGFGLINAEKAIDLAKEHKLLGPEVNETKTAEEVKQILSGKDMVSHITMEKSFILEHTRIAVWITCAQRGDISVKLISPFGTKSQLSETHHDMNPNYDGWEFGSIVNWGESSNGTFQLIIQNGGPNEAIFTKWRLITYGHDGVFVGPPKSQKGSGGKFSWEICIIFVALLLFI